MASSSSVDVNTNVNASSSNTSNINDHITITVNGLTKTINQNETGGSSNLHIEASDVNGVSSITVNGVKESTPSGTVSPDTNIKEAPEGTAEASLLNEDVTVEPTEAHNNPLSTLLGGLEKSLVNFLQSIFH